LFAGVVAIRHIARVDGEPGEVNPVRPFVRLEKRPAGLTFEDSIMKTAKSKQSAALASHEALIISRLRNAFALDYEAARRSAEDVMVNLLAVSRAARTCAERTDFGRAQETGEALSTLAENLALPDLAEVARAYVAACEAEDAAELRAATRRLLAVLGTFGIAEVTLEQNQLEDEP